jgi:hypothetical protein
LRLAIVFAVSVAASACGAEIPDPSAENEARPQIPGAKTNLKALPSDIEQSSRAVPVPLEPPVDPSLAGLSPARQREYDRGYRDCARGHYAFDAEQQGEYYRIGCMTAENAKTDGER